MNPEEELKPCPFCGGEAKLNQNSGHNSEKSKIWCIKCFVELSFEWSSSYTKEQAIQAWNTRPPAGEGLVKLDIDEDELTDFLDFWGYRQENLMKCNYDDFKNISKAICQKYGTKPQEESIEHDLSVYGQYIEKDGKRIDPKDFYKDGTKQEMSNKKVNADLQKALDNCIELAKRIEDYEKKLKSKTFSKPAVVYPEKKSVIGQRIDVKRENEVFNEAIDLFRKMNSYE